MPNSAAPEPSRNWWQTIPGVLTALAAVISAVAGLIVALNGRPAVRSPERTEPSRTERTLPTTASSTAADARPAGQRALTGAVTLPSDPEVRLSGGKLVLRIVSARVEPFNAEERVLRLSIRWTNDDKSFVRNYWWTLRLVVDGVSRAPEDWGYEQVEAHSARELPYSFKVPAAAGRVVLAISNDSGERAELPLELGGR
jgi:hypothetical protein